MFSSDHYDKVVDWQGQEVANLVQLVGHNHLYSILNGAVHVNFSHPDFI